MLVSWVLLALAVLRKQAPRGRPDAPGASALQNMRPQAVPCDPCPGAICLSCSARAGARENAIASRGQRRQISLGAAHALNTGLFFCVLYCPLLI